MELNKSQIEYIRSSLSNYDSKHATEYDNEDFIIGLIYAIELKLKEDLDYEITDRKGITSHTDISTQTMYFNPTAILKHLKKAVETFKNLYPNIKDIDLYNFFFVERILYEICRVEQANMAYRHQYTHEEIARLYRLLFDALGKKIAPGKLSYILNPREFFPERNAEIMSNLAMANIYRDSELQNVATGFYVAALFNGYDLQGKCPAKTSLEKCHLPYAVDKRGISFRDAFYNGMTIDTDKYNTIVDFLADKTIEQLDAIEIDEKIRSLG